MRRAVLAVDLGTGGPKVAYVSLDGVVLDSEHSRVETRSVGDGGAVQDSTQWWDAVLAGARAIAQRAAVSPDQVVGVACTGQWGSTVPVGADGEAVGDCMLWFDRRGREHAKRVLGGPVKVEGYTPRKAMEWVKRSGGAPSPGGNDPLGHRLWIEHEEPDVYRRTATFLEPIDYLNLRLTGRVAATQVTQTLWWLTDNRRGATTAYDDTLVGYSQADPTRLAPLLPVDSVVGPLLEQVAEDMGVPAGIPVVTGLPDLHSTTLGSGAVADFESHISISTSAWVGCHTPSKRTSLMKQMATVPSAVPGRYLLANNHETAGLCMEWLRDNVLLADDGLTRESASLSELDELAQSSTHGSNGVIFTPWLNGERSPVADTKLRASFHNLSLQSVRADLIRSVLEGVAYNARWLLEASEGVLRHPLGEPRILGGGARSDLWVQIHADVLDRRVHRVRDPLMSAVRGAGLFAGLVLGEIGLDDIASMSLVEKTFAPDPASREVHDLHFKEFVRLARSERTMHKRLNSHRATAPTGG